MSKKQNRRSEKYIHIEERNGSLRFKVTVGDQVDSATFTNEAEGMRWARRRRQTFLDNRDAVQMLLPAGCTAVPCQVPPPSYVIPLSNNIPAPIKMSEVFDSFETNDLSHLAGKNSEKSRLANLRRWFGERTLDQLDRVFIQGWMADRRAGKLGSGRDPRRAETMAGRNGEKPLTKQQRYAKKRAGEEVPPAPIHPVSAQSVRHELCLLRRSVTKYLEQGNREAVYGAWWHSHFLMRMELPAQSDPRSRRVSDAELVSIFNGISDVSLKSSILFGVLTSLRRGEVVSLKWEDVDYARKVVRLRKPCNSRRTKVVERDVPLLPGAVKLLQDLGPQKKGPIFGKAAASVSNGWRDAADKAEIYDARLHDCRREAISRLVELCELTIPEVAAGFSGHSDIRTLQKYYLRLDSARMASKLSVNAAAANMAPSV